MKNFMVCFVLISILFLGCNATKIDESIFQKKVVNIENPSVSRELVIDEDYLYSIDSEFIGSKYYDLLITKLDSKLNVIQKKRSNLELHYRTSDMINTTDELIIGVLYSPIDEMTINECGVLIFNKNDFGFSLKKLPDLTNAKSFKIVKADDGYSCIIKNANDEMKFIELSNEFTEITTKDLIEDFSKFITVNDEKITINVLENELVVSELTSDFSNIINSKRIELDSDKYIINDIISNNEYLLIALKDSNSKQIQIVRLTTSLDDVMINNFNASSFAFCNKNQETYFTIIFEEDKPKLEIMQINSDFTFETIKSYQLSNYQVISYLNCFNDEFFIGGSIYSDNSFHSIIYTLK